MLDGRRGVSNHWQSDSLLNSLYRLRTSNIKKLHIPDFCEGNIHTQKASDAESVFVALGFSVHPIR